jgi:diguanylate cyclase (GGDEF)-like protein
MHGAQADLLVVCSAPSRRVSSAAILRARTEAETLGVPWVVLEPDHDEADAVTTLFAGGEYVHSRMGPAEVWARMARRIAAGQKERELVERAQTDALTGLPNYGALIERLHSELKRARRYGHSLCAVMIDVDHLKRVNDRHGHEAGNRAIAMVAQHLAVNVRETDFAARFGGDEFNLVLPHHRAREARVLCERLQTGLLHLKGGRRLVPFDVTFSAGIAEYAGEAPPLTPDSLLEAADEALRTAKRAGRARVIINPRPRTEARPTARQPPFETTSTVASRSASSPAKRRRLQPPPYSHLSAAGAPAHTPRSASAPRRHNPGRPGASPPQPGPR